LHAIAYSTHDEEIPAVTGILDAVLLHWTPEKAIWIGDLTLPWDARCAGIYIGFGVGTLFHLIVEARANRLPPLPALLFFAGLLAPLFIDVGTAQLGLRSASNDWRLLTGAL